MRQTLLAAAAAAALSIAAPASAEIIVLDFEGVGDLNPVGNFYNGGAGTNYGVEFSGDTLAVVDADDGGSGNFANEPSSNTIMFFLNANNAILNFAAGFTTGFSFFYSSSTAATVNVYDGLNGTGNLLGSLNLDAQGFQNCTGDPGGDFCNWTAVGVAFAGTAKSINFGGTANQTGFDDITFGSDRPGGTIVPEPSTWAMMLLGFAGLGSALRMRRRLAVA
ncbi:MAG: PEP-CTERM sorting domain-containing protein [Phenylobacterium zucineum]|nr:MAG: PEP-CTERM sorting domain-containing protein [Phenylobacterium zucineum]